MPRAAHPCLRALVVAGVVCVAPLTGATAATTSTGHSGWKWSNPAPTGETLYAVSFAGMTGYAVGVDGALARSDDGGGTWRGLASGTTTTLGGVAMSTPPGFTTWGGCDAWRSGTGSPPLVSVVLDRDAICRGAVASAAFPTSQNGYLLRDDGSVTVTPDGGATYGRRASLPHSRAAGGTRSAAALAVIPGGLVALVGTDVVRSVDGGASWAVVARGTTSLADVAFPRPSRGYAVGDGQLLVSVDGGGSWAVAPSSPEATGARRIACADELTCVITSANSPRVLRTTDGGQTLTATVPTGGVVNDVAFASPTRAVAVGRGGLVATSDDAGATWTERRAYLKLALDGLRVSGRDVVARGPSGTVVRSVDGGETWGAASVPTTANIVDATFPTAAKGFAADSDGTAFVTANGGQSWRTLQGGLGAATVGLRAPSAGRVIVWSRSGVRMSRGGARFVAVSLPFSRGHIVDVLTQRGRLFLVARRAVWTSDSWGRRWRVMPLPAASIRIRQVACPARSVCWLLTGSRRVYVTRDRGKHWRDVTAAAGRPRGVARFNGIAAQSARVAVLSSNSGRVFVTRDAGATFAPQRVSPAEVVAVASAPGLSAALDSRGFVFVTTSAGREGPPARLVMAARPAHVDRAGTVVLRGRLTPGRATDVVVTSSAGDTYVVRTDARGRFARRVPVTGTTTFVAQWDGDATPAGVGSRVVRVRG